MRQRIYRLHVLCAAASALIVIPAPAAEIRWGVFDITGKVTDVSTDGTLVEARAGADGGEKPDEVDGGTFEVNGVTFGDGFTLDEPTHSDTLNSRCGVPSSGPDREYYILLRNGDRKGNGGASITFKGLTIGNTYQVQVWVSDNNANPPGDLRLVLGNGATAPPDPGKPGHATLNPKTREGSPGQYALGTFRADAASQSFGAQAWKGFNGTPAAAPNTFVNAVQLRDLGAGAPDKQATPEKSPPRAEIKITRHIYDKPSDRYFVEWTSKAGEAYGVYLSENAGSVKTCIAALVRAEAEKTSFGPFPNPRPGNAHLTFEIGPPDTTPPACNRAWGAGTRVSLHFSGAMKPGTAIDPSNYSLACDDGTQVSVKAAKPLPGGSSILLTTSEPLKLATGYSVTMKNLTDIAGRTLGHPEVSFRTWDNSPQGVKVFILAGESNMVGHGQYDTGLGGKTGGVGSLREQVTKNPDQYGHLVDAAGKWRKLDGMMFWWNRADPGGPPRISKGPLTVGFGAGTDCIGPEYGFGMALEQSFALDPVLIIKTAWDGRSLHEDFRSPTAGSRRDGRIGPHYLQMMDQVHQVLDQLGEEFPMFDFLGYQICGFGWHQGRTDMLDDMLDGVTGKAYEENLAMFIRDIRADFGKPRLPVCIATAGQGGMDITPASRSTLAGQLAVADPAKYPEFAGNVTTVDTRPFQRDAGQSPKEDAGLWHHNGETLYLIGKGMGDAMVKMLADP